MTRGRVQEVLDLTFARLGEMNLFKVEAWTTVSAIRKDLFPESTGNIASQTRKGADGRTTNTGNIGRKPAVSPPETPTPEPAKPTGKTILNGVLSDDPAEIAVKRAAGKIAPGSVPVVTINVPEPIEIQRR